MELLIAGAGLGVVGIVVLFILKGSIKLFTPRRFHQPIDANFDAGLRFVGRWLGRALVVFFVGLVAYVIWVTTRQN